MIYLYIVFNHLLTPLAMKKIFLAFLLLMFFSQANAQYKFGIGGYFNSTPIPNSTKPDASSYDFSMKFVFDDYSCYDMIFGFQPEDNFHFTIMKEVHRQLFYPVDFYIGLGIHLGSWNSKHFTSQDLPLPENKMFAGLSGSLGLQFTLMPFAVSVGWRPVWDLVGGDRFDFVKQLGVRYCF